MGEMADQQIIDYLRDNKDQSREVLRTQLVSAGYQEADISAAEAVVDGAPPPPPPPAVGHPPPPPPASVAPIVQPGPRLLHPKAVQLFFIRGVFIWLFIAVFVAPSIFLTMFSDDAGTAAFAVIAFLIFIGVTTSGSYIWAKYSYKFYKYELTENEFKKELGVIRKKYVTIPYDRIQNIDMHRGIIDRLLGITGLDLQTAGSSGSSSRRRGMFRGEAEGYIPGLAHEDAEALREEIMSHVKETSGHGV